MNLGSISYWKDKPKFYTHSYNFPGSILINNMLKHIPVSEEMGGVSYSENK